MGDLTSGTDTAINKASDLSEKFKKTATFGIKASWRLAQKQRQEVDAEWVTEKQKLHVEFALSEPVKYWKARKFWNYVMAGVLYVATIAGVYWVGSGAFDIAEEYGWIRLLLLLPSEAGEWGRVAVLGLALGLIVALVRIPLNRANGYLHLGNDAGERVAAIRTFLALRAADHIKEAEIEAVVTRIFMPANDGVVKDDIGVVTYFDLLNKFKKGPS